MSVGLVAQGTLHLVDERFRGHNGDIYAGELDEEGGEVSLSASMALVVYLFVARNKYHDPELQNPGHMAFLVFIAICMIPIGYLCTPDV